MRFFLSALVAIFVWSAGAQFAQARDVALVLGNSDPGGFRKTERAQRLEGVTRDLQANGFDVVVVVDKVQAEAVADLRRFNTLANRADRVLIWVDGIVVSSNREAWVLEPGAGSVDHLSVGLHGVPLSPLMAVLANHQGQAMMLVATEAPARGRVVNLSPGVGRFTVPQGVTLVSGPPLPMVRFMQNVTAQQGAGVGELVKKFDVLQGRGYLPRALPFRGPQGERDNLTEVDFWEVVQIIDNQKAYRSYLERYPGGRFEAPAQQRLRALESRDREDADRRAEEALGLSVETRRAIQRDLELLGFDAGGVDGIFGPGTRGAITAWQRANRVPVTSFLTADQVALLSSQAATRVAELEREARERRLALERADRAYWQRTGQGADEDGLRDYLARYPDGLFSDEARQRLDEIEEERRRVARTEDRRAWERAREGDSIAAYRRYLRDFPKGQFVKQARARIKALEDDEATRERREAAKREEQKILQAPLMRQLAESALDNAGFDPGPVDGRFTDKTRKAIRKFQRDQGLTATGYIDKVTMVRLLAARR